MKAFKQGITTITTDLVDLYPDYISTFAYSSGSKCTHNGFYWELISGTITDKEPKDGSLYWKKIGVANKASITDVRALTKSSKVGGFYLEFANSLDKDVLAIGYFSAYRLRIEAFSTDGTVLKTYYDKYQDINENVFDYYDYIYEDYSMEVDRTLFLKLSPIGVKIRLTFESGSGFVEPNCGFVMWGKSVDFGDTLSEVNFKYNSYAVKSTDEFGMMEIDPRNVQELIDFTTAIDKGTFTQVKKKVKTLYNEFCVFVLDPTKEDDTSFAGIASIQDVSHSYDEFDKSIISWSIIEAI